MFNSGVFMFVGCVKVGIGMILCSLNILMLNSFDFCLCSDVLRWNNSSLKWLDRVKLVLLLIFF